METMMDVLSPETIEGWMGRVMAVGAALSLFIRQVRKTLIQLYRAVRGLPKGD